MVLLLFNSEEATREGGSYVFGCGWCRDSDIVFDVRLRPWCIEMPFIDSSSISLGITGDTPQPPGSCDTVDRGYQCMPNISRFWGQYSPYFNVPSAISSDMANECQLTFANILSRHGGRDPTEGKSDSYAGTIDKIKSHVQTFEGDYRFLTDYKYELGADQLTGFGELQMANSGTDFFTRYADLAISAAPFIRASGQQRVIDSAERFSQGFHTAKVANGKVNDAQYPYDIVIISENTGSNNTLDHGLCSTFEASNTSHVVQHTFASTFIPAITARLNAGLPNANLTDQDAIDLMDLCPFETVASPGGRPSLFCALFTEDEWKQYDYYQTLGKYYGYGPGAPLGPTQGVGFVNELIARLTAKPVVDHTTVNQTLDANPATFPLGMSLYADFGHDNDMTAVFAALGLYNSTPLLTETEVMTVEEMNGYSAAWTVPFAARAIFEKMQCEGEAEEMVRVLVNGRVLALEMCGGDAFGKCPLSRFVGSLDFAQNGGHWDQCFIDTGVAGGGVAQSTSAAGDIVTA